MKAAGRKQKAGPKRAAATSASPKKAAAKKATAKKATAKKTAAKMPRRAGVAVQPSNHQDIRRSAREPRISSALGASIVSNRRALRPCERETCGAASHRQLMSKRISRNFPAMLTQLTLSSWETIYHRSLMMAEGTLSVAEYQRMIMEKAAAMQASTLALMTGRGSAAAMAPYLVRCRANARRLRRG